MAKRSWWSHEVLQYRVSVNSIQEFIENRHLQLTSDTTANDANLAILNRKFYLLHFLFLQNFRMTLSNVLALLTFGKIDLCSACKIQKCLESKKTVKVRVSAQFLRKRQLFLQTCCCNFLRITRMWCFWIIHLNMVNMISLNIMVYVFLSFLMQLCVFGSNEYLCMFYDCQVFNSYSTFCDYVSF